MTDQPANRLTPEDVAPPEEPEDAAGDAGDGAAHPIRVVMVDDHRMFLSGVQAEIAATEAETGPTVEVVASQPGVPISGRGARAFGREPPSQPVPFGRQPRWRSVALSGR